MRIKYYKVSYKLTREGKMIIVVGKNHTPEEAIIETLDTSEFDLNDFDVAITKKKPVAYRKWRTWRNEEGIW